MLLRGCVTHPSLGELQPGGGTDVGRKPLLLLCFWGATMGRGSTRPLLPKVSFHLSPKWWRASHLPAKVLVL